MFARVFPSVRRVFHPIGKRSMSSFQLPASIREKVPVYGAIVGTLALMFQIAVLYPWHEELSEQFNEVEVNYFLFKIYFFIFIFSIKNCLT